jgi:hypothetical protein
MAESSTVTALRAERDELERIISSYEKAIEAARRDLAHVNATLQPSKMSIIRVFRRDEIFQICKVALAQAPTGIDNARTRTGSVANGAPQGCSVFDY